jgi:Zn-dependent peptidase ImmA (M78 family)
MEAAELAARVRERYAARDIYEIAEKAGLTIVFQNWRPVTAGELNRQTKTIYVNGDAKIAAEKIVAHELGHYFLGEFEVGRIGDEEGFCDDFARELLK